jgi:hypothetical protein
MGDVTEIHGKLDKLSIDLSNHVAREEEWQGNIEEKIDDHLTSHRTSADRWLNGWVGLTFTLVGALLVAAWEFFRGK